MNPQQEAADTRIDRPLLRQLLVCSIARGEPTADDLQRLKDEAAHNNRNRGLTGVLLYDRGVFVHWLEGLADYLHDAWTSIARDKRHEKLLVLWDDTDAPERLFGDWSMGLRSPIIAHDLLQVMRVVKQQQSPKAMLREGYYELFSEAFELLERMGSVVPHSIPPGTYAAAQALLGPAQQLALKMQQKPFTPTFSASETQEAAPYQEFLSSLSDASSMFRNSIPAEHDALFDMAAEGMDDLLTMLDMPMRVALGQQLWDMRKELSDRPVHWVYDEKLVVVVDHETWKVGIHPELTATTLEQSRMVTKPRGANAIPTQFRQTSAYALFWAYADSELAKEIKLPQRFMTQRIRLRRPPPLPAPTLRAEHRKIVALLGKKSELFVDLAQAMGLSKDPMQVLLKPLYAARCIGADAETGVK